MAQGMITQEEVDKCKGCAHPKTQRTTVRGYFSDTDEYMTAEVCSACCGVLENDVLVHPLFPQTVMIGRHKANIEAAQRRYLGK